MKSFFSAQGLLMFLGGIASYFFPWWTVVIAAFAVGAFMNKSSVMSFGFGFAAIFLLWSLYAGILNNTNGSILANKIGALFSAGAPISISGLQLVYITGLIGGIIGGMGAMSGTLFRNIFSENRR